MISEIAKALVANVWFCQLKQTKLSKKLGSLHGQWQERTARCNRMDTARISLGAGEILITSIDNEGTRKGFDCDLIRAVSTVSHVPIIASGGMGKPEDMVDVS